MSDPPDSVDSPHISGPEDSAAFATEIEQLCRLKRWPELDAAVERLKGYLREQPGAFELKPATQVLGSLRKRRRFAAMEDVGECLLLGFPEVAEIQRQIVQADIDQGHLLEAQSELTELLALTAKEPGSKEWVEARGLQGRLRKQSFVNGRAVGRKGRPVFRLLRGAIDAYREAWEYEPARSDSSDRAAYERRNHWPGINLVACAARAEHEGQGTDVRWKRIAERILAAIAADWTPESGDATWSAASALEACVALERWDEARVWLDRYLATPYTDAFELASTARQLQEVWEIEPADSGPGALVATLVGRRLVVDEGDFQGSPRVLQAVHGHESYVDAKWVAGLQRSFGAAVRIRHGGRGVASGFVVDGSDLHPNLKGRGVVLTNQHVVSDTGYCDDAYRSSQVRLEFNGIEEPHRIRRQLWPDAGEPLDVAVLEVDGACPGRELQSLSLKNLDHERRPPPRLYVIGYPLGGELQVALYDNRFVRAERTSILYRSPTDQGSSGSPVMNHDFEVVAVHCSALVGEQANEGVLLDAVRERMKEHPPQKP